MPFDITGEVPVAFHRAIPAAAPSTAIPAAAPSTVAHGAAPSARRPRRPPAVYPGATIGDGLTVRASGIPGAGNGLFADRPFASGEIITKYEGPIIQIPPEPHAEGASSHWASLVRGTHVVDGRRVPVVGEGGGSFMNHKPRSEANAKLVKNPDPHVTQLRAASASTRPYGIFVEATADIARGEEIFLWYGASAVQRLAGVG
jgi:hypothetical protein